MKRTGLTAFAMASVLALSSIPLLAADQITLTQTYEIDVKDGENYEKEGIFEEKISEENRDYVLQNVSFLVTDKSPAIVRGTLTKETKEVSFDKDYSPDKEIKDDGKTYVLSDTKITERLISEEHTQKVTEKELFDGTYTETTVPQQKTVTVKNEVTGDEAAIELTLTSFEEKTVKEDKAIDIYYTDYDSDYYIFDGIEVERNDEKPALTGYEETILREAGFDPALSRITDIIWNGAAYTDTDGIVKRNALAYVETTIYEAAYTGVIETPKKTEYTYTLTYTYEGDIKSEELIHCCVTATATYEAVAAPINIPLTVGISLAILALVIIFILFILSKKRKENEEKAKSMGKER